jgi:hypothetical protein
VAITLGCIRWVYSVQLDYELRSLGGILIPASDPNPPNPCKKPIPNDAVVIYYGDSASFSRNNSVSIISSNGEEFMGITKGRDGTIGLNANIRSSDGKVIALISQNGFDVNKNNIIESTFSRPDRSTIRFTDQSGNKFDIRFLNKRAIRLSGKFFLNARSSVEIREDGMTIMMPSRNRFSRSCSNRVNGGTLFSL